MEIERKFIIKEIPLKLDVYPVRHMEQMYISTKPVIRIRKYDDKRVLTVKSKGLVSRQEYELFLDADEYNNLRCMASGNIIEKDRYIIPLTDTDGSCGEAAIDKQLVIELDIFKGQFDGLIYAEVEFPSEELAECFAAPSWFLKDVTKAGIFQNSALSMMEKDAIPAFITDAYKED